MCDAWGGQKGALYPQELVLQMVVSYQVRAENSGPLEEHLVLSTAECLSSLHLFYSYYHNNPKAQYVSGFFSLWITSVFATSILTILHNKIILDIYILSLYLLAHEFLFRSIYNYMCVLYTSMYTSYIVYT